MTADILLEARNLTCVFGRHRAVSDLSLRVRRGECLGLLGVNGAGKSSTLKMLSGVVAPRAGQVFVGGFDLQRTPLKARAQLGYLPDVPPLFSDMRVRGYLEFCAGLRAVADRPRAVASAAARCDLQDVLDREIRSLSKGYQQRVGIAQAIVHEPPVLILDEPSVGLDPRQLREMRALVKTLTSQRAVVLSTHLLSEVEHLCTHVAIIHRGLLVHEADVSVRGSQLRLVVRKAALEPARLTNIPGVLAASPAGPGCWLLTVHEEAVAEEIARVAVDEVWGLRRLEAVGSALEETFLSLTVREPPSC